jgi:hypothetical protein
MVTFIAFASGLLKIIRQQICLKVQNTTQCEPGIYKAELVLQFSSFILNSEIVNCRSLYLQ